MKLRLGLYLGLFLLLAISAAAQTEHPLTNLTAQDEINITFTPGANQTNITQIFPVACLLPANATQTTNSTQTVCEVDRTLAHGETFVKDTAACDLQISAPQCEENPGNVSHKVRWRVQGDGNKVEITYLNDNVSRSYPLGDNFDFEDEFSLQCPATTQGSGSEPFVDGRQVNITDTEFLNYCVRPFGEFSYRIQSLSQFYENATSDYQADLGACRESNKNLAAENAKLKEQATQLNNCQSESQGKDGQIENLAAENSNLRSKADSAGFWKTMFWLLFSAVLVVAICWSTWVMINRMLGAQQRGDR